MAFDPQATAWHENHAVNVISEALDKLQDKELAEIIYIVLRANRDYANAEDENILSEVKDIDACLIDDPEDRLHNLEVTVEQLQRENRYMLSRLAELEG